MFHYFVSVFALRAPLLTSTRIKIKELWLDDVGEFDQEKNFFNSVKSQKKNRFIPLYKQGSSFRSPAPHNRTTVVNKSTRKQTADPNFSLSDLKVECTGRGCHGDVRRGIECEIFNKQSSPGCALFCCKALRKRLEHERSRGKHEPQASVSPYFLSVLARFLSALQQNRAQPGLLYLFYNKEFINFSTNSRYFQNKL